MTLYLPDDSPMKQGLDIMNEEFPQMAMGSVRVMFTDLPKEEIPSVLERLKKVENVTSVDYGEGEKYNKGNYTLFSLNTDFAFNTPEEIQIEKNVRETFSDKEVVVQHSEAIISEIPLWIFILVFIVLLVVLLIMCSSWIEPLLFLVTIGIAVIINLGTNIFMGNVARTTFALSAILQFALSMDYSIMLMNRARQERQNGEKPIEAMKRAFQAAFPSIIGSAMTTVLGLIMLIFMRFKIGFNLGIVMAKGVALSLICVMTVLPALILIFEKVIDKTAKKEPKIPTNYLARFGFKARHVLVGVFAGLFIGSFFLQSFSKISFAQPKDDDIENVFPSPNPVVLLYENEDEDKIDALIEKLEKTEGINTVFANANTLSSPLTSEQMAASVSEFNPDMNINPVFLKILYYNYFKGDELPDLTPKEFVTFLSENADNEIFKEYLDKDITDNINKIIPLTDKQYLQTKKTAYDIANLFGISKEQVSMLFVYNYANNSHYAPPALTLPVFVDFLRKDIAKNPMFANKIDAEMLEALDKISPFLDKAALQAPLSPEKMSETLGIDIRLVQQLYMLKFGSLENAEMSLYDFVNYVITDIAQNPTFAPFIPQDLLAQMYEAKGVMDAVVSDTAFSYKDMAKFLSIGEKETKLIYTYRVAKRSPSALKMSIEGFVNYIISDILPNKALSSAFNADMKKQIKAFDALIEAVVSERKLNNEEMLNLLLNFTDKIDKNKIELFYLYYGATTEFDNSWTLSIEKLFNHISEDIIPNPIFSTFIDENIKASVKDAEALINGAKANLKGENHSRILLDLSLPQESPETTAFMQNLTAELDNTFDGNYSLIGKSAMNVEMELTFKKDLILITALTAIAIFIVVALTFRSFAIPLILVLLVQCGVFITIAFSSLMGSMYFLSLLIVQCILMGATVDYAIVFTNYYIENRKTLDVKQALEKTFKESIHTILTSSIIIIVITGIIGLSPADPAISEICLTLSVGTISALLLILFVLPGLIATFDRVVTKRKREKKVKQK